MDAKTSNAHNANSLPIYKFIFSFILNRPIYKINGQRVSENDVKLTNYFTRSCSKFMTTSWAKVEDIGERKIEKRK